MHSSHRTTFCDFSPHCDDGCKGDRADSPRTPAMATAGERPSSKSVLAGQKEVQDLFGSAQQWWVPAFPLPPGSGQMTEHGKGGGLAIPWRGKRSIWGGVCLLTRLRVQSWNRHWTRVKRLRWPSITNANAVVPIGTSTSVLVPLGQCQPNGATQRCCSCWTGTRVVLSIGRVKLVGG